ncbi:MAG: FtsX-like permease family protein [Gammaproteobacteria bacterium]|nr:FtsX-like permease family protein [Gammaproteobacteria bacterium]
MTSFLFALRALKRQWFAGELRLLMLALGVAVGSVTAVGFFTDRIEGLMVNQAGELLAADLVISGSRPIPDAWKQAAKTRGLKQARTVTFPSVVVAGEALQLAQVKAVGEGYPLRGQLRLRDTLYGAEHPAERPPSVGEAWLDPRLAALLQRQVGETLQLGQLELNIGSVIAYEPDRGGDFFSIAPRLMFPLEQLQASGLIQPGSRASYRLLLAGEPAALAQFRQSLGADIESEGFRILTVEDARPELRVALQRARNFLSLATVITTILAGVAIAASARRYAARNQDNTAIMRCYGASTADIRRHYLYQLGLLGLVGSLFGTALGYAAHYPVLLQLGELIQLDHLPTATWAPLVTGLLTGLLVVIGFALPPILALGDVPPLRVLRKDLGAPKPSYLSMTLLAVLGVAFILWWQLQSLQLVVIMLGGILLSLLLLALLSLGMLKAVLPLRRHFPITLRFGIANLVRRRADTVAQVLAFGLAIMVILLLTVVRNDLLDAWRADLPEDAPNHFLINVQTHEVAGLREFLAGNGVQLEQIYPSVRARLKTINGETVQADRYEDERARRLASREFNLSWSSTLPEDNSITEGSWWASPAEDPAQISLDDELTQTLGLKLGDRLGFSIAGTPLEVRITSTRQIEWDNFRVNFFAMLPPEQLEGFPAMWLTSLYLSPQQKPLLNELIKRYPNITVIDVAGIMQQVRGIMDKVSQAIQFVFLFTLLAGVVLLFTAIQTTLDVRMKEGAMLRTFGATSHELQASQIAEFASIGVLASVLGILSANALVMVLGSQVLQLDYVPDLWTSLLALLAGTLGITLAGLLGTRRLKHMPSWQLIRE